MRMSEDMQLMMEESLPEEAIQAINQVSSEPQNWDVEMNEEMKMIKI